jgi:hypothetical protein
MSEERSLEYNLSQHQAIHLSDICLQFLKSFTLAEDPWDFFEPLDKPTVVQLGLQGEFPGHFWPPMARRSGPP